jgi:Helicase associated domain
MDNSQKFKLYIEAIKQYAARQGDCNIPSTHVEKVNNLEVTVGAWAGYIRHRYKKNQLSEEKVWALNQIRGWQWGPLKPGPSPDLKRNRKIHEMRAAGSSLREIADAFDLSRQRIHQIVRTSNE